MNIVIIGGSRGIGKAAARELLQDGHKVLIVGRGPFPVGNIRPRKSYCPDLPAVTPGSAGRSEYQTLTGGYVLGSRNGCLFSSQGNGGNYRNLS